MLPSHARLPPPQPALPVQHQHPPGVHSDACQPAGIPYVSANHDHARRKAMCQASTHHWPPHTRHRHELFRDALLRCITKPCSLILSSALGALITCTRTKAAPVPAFPSLCTWTCSWSTSAFTPCPKLHPPCLGPFPTCRTPQTQPASQSPSIYHTICHAARVLVKLRVSSASTSTSPSLGFPNWLEVSIVSLYRATSTSLCLRPSGLPNDKYFPYDTLEAKVRSVTCTPRNTP